MKNDNFFSKSYVYPSIWAIIIGIFGFLCGLIWQNWAGPEKVIVLNKALNNDHNIDTTVTIIRFQPDEKYFDNLAKLTRKEVQQSYPKKAEATNKRKEVDSLSLLVAREYQIKFDSIRLSTVNEDIKRLNVKDNLISKPNGNQNYFIPQIKRPKFKLPSIVSGYTEGKINSYATFNLNSLIFKKNEKIEVSLDFFDKSTIVKITPLFVELVEPKTENSAYYVWGEQYEIKEKKSLLTFSADFKKGKYLLTTGFYFLNEINQKYPEFYCKKFEIEIK